MAAEDRRRAAIGRSGVAADPAVSVIVSIYGELRRPEVLRAVLRRWRRQDLAVDLVLSEQAAAPAARRLARQVGARHVHSVPDSGGGRPRFNIGRVRNAGLAAALAEHLYFTDSDVYPLRRDYLARLLAGVRTVGAGNLYRPPLFRLAEREVPAFLAHVRGREVEVPSLGDFCLCSFRRGALVAQPQVKRRVDGWIHVCTPREAALLDGDPPAAERRSDWILRPDVHWGGTFVRRRDAIEAGGFCEGYHGWGLEDEDFHDKLRAVASLTPIAGRELVHFEHPRPYRNPDYWRNERRHRRRRAGGAAAMISGDRADPRSLFAAWRRGDDEALRRFMEPDRRPRSGGARAAVPRGTG